MFFLHHHGSIGKFVLRLKSSPSVNNVDRWIFLLSKHQIQEFALCINRRVSYVVSAPIFSSQHLTDFSLKNYVFKPPPGFSGYKKLVSLNFTMVKFEPATSHIFISQCPLLENMTLFCCTSFDKLEINAPSLKYFNFHGSFMSISFRKSLNLEVLCLAFDDGAIGRHDLYFNLVTHVCFLRKLQYLWLHGGLLELLDCGQGPKQLPITLKRFHFLRLNIDFGNVGQVLFVLFFIKSSNLKIVRDSCTSMTSNNEDVVELLRTHITSKWNFSGIFWHLHLH